MTLDAKRTRLLTNGIFLFMLGLLIGFFTDFGVLANARMGLAAHLEGILNGTFLMVLALLWAYVELPPLADSVARTLPVFGAYLNWILAAFAAVFGRGRNSPIHPADRPWFPLEHVLVELGLALLSVGFIVCCVLVLWGLRRGARMRSAQVVST
jgi:hydroxylaminobenzene mutase